MTREKKTPEQEIARLKKANRVLREKVTDLNKELAEVQSIRMKAAAAVITIREIDEHYHELQELSAKIDRFYCDLWKRAGTLFYTFDEGLKNHDLEFMPTEMSLH